MKLIENVTSVNDILEVMMDTTTKFTEKAKKLYNQDDAYGELCNFVRIFNSKAADMMECRYKMYNEQTRIKRYNEDFENIFGRCGLDSIKSFVDAYNRGCIGEVYKQFPYIGLEDGENAMEKIITDIEIKNLQTQYNIDSVVMEHPDIFHGLKYMKKDIPHIKMTIFARRSRYFEKGFRCTAEITFSSPINTELKKTLCEVTQVSMEYDIPAKNFTKSSPFIKKYTLLQFRKIVENIAAINNDPVNEYLYKDFKDIMNDQNNTITVVSLARKW